MLASPPVPPESPRNSPQEMFWTVVDYVKPIDRKALYCYTAIFKYQASRETKAARETEERMSEELKRILIVEDSSMTRSMIRAVVEEFDDYETVEAKNGFEALKLLPTEEFSLIITDINMPDINGLELINFVKKNPRYKDIPLMIISTEKSEEDKRRGMSMGANAYVTKPFNPEDLQAAIEGLLNK